MIGRIGKQWRRGAVQGNVEMDAPFAQIGSRHFRAILRRRLFARQGIIEVQINRPASIRLANDDLMKIDTLVEGRQGLARLASRPKR